MMPKRSEVWTQGVLAPHKTGSPFNERTPIREQASGLSAGQGVRREDGAS